MIGTPDLDAATADAIAGEMTRAAKHALPLGAPCPNCGVPLKGAWCYGCGQKGTEYQRSIWHLTAEAFEGLTHFDGRVWRTLPRLVLKPGQLTRDYLDGHRASQIAPFRLFLIVLVIVFFAGGLDVERNRNNIKIATLNSPEVQRVMTPKDRAEVNKGVAAMRAQLARPKQTSAQEGWLRRQMVRAMDKPEAFKAAIGEWGHRFAILMLPIAALLMTALFVFKRGVYVFDHLIFSMHSLAFQGLLATVVFMLGALSRESGWLLLVAPIHLFAHMRGTYRTSVIGALLRMTLLFVGSAIAVGILMLGLMLVGLASVQ
jgi:hypothetical protein